MFELACPNCGSPVPFNSKSSLFAVCPNCKSSSIRKDLNLENYGKVSELQDDSSPLQIGTIGRHLDKSFTIVGRIQLQYELGFWNEWHFIDNNEHSGWIGEAMGQYMVTRLQTIDNPKNIPFESDIEKKSGSLLKTKDNKPKYAGDQINLNNRSWTVREISTATCISGEGELPFKFDGGYSAVLVDLADSSKDFGTLDFSENPPLLFVGDMVDFDDFHFQNLKDPRFSEKRAGKEPKSISCTSCGAPLTINFPQFTNTVSCQYCGSVLDVTNPELKILSEFKTKEKYKPIFPLGAKCNLFEKEYSVIGYMRRSVTKDKILYPWEEYLLYNPKGYIWLNCTDNHWMVFAPIKGVPTTNFTAFRPYAYFDNLKYPHFQSGEGKVDYAVGEFYWRVHQNDKAQLEDFVDPPFMLSLEKTNSEIIWTKGEYLPKEKIEKAFQLTSPLPTGQGIGPAQPNPLKKIWKRNLKIALISLIAGIIFQIGYCSNTLQKNVFTKNFTYVKDASEKSFVTDLFHLEGKEKNVQIEIQSPSLDNKYIYFAIALINSKTDSALDTGLELSYYHGVDDGESWSEGSKNETIILEEVEEGDYYLRIEPESDASIPLNYTILVTRDEPRYLPFILFILFIFPPTIWSFYKYKSFETERMNNSDYASYSSGSSDDDTDE